MRPSPPMTFRSPSVQHLVHDRVLAPELLQHVGVGAPAGLGLFPGRQPQLVKEDLAELLRGLDVELPPRVPPDALLQAGDVLVEALAEVIERFAVYQKARVLHVGKHTAERQLRRFIEREHFPLFHLLLQRRCKLPHGLRPGQLLPEIAHGQALRRVVAAGGVEQIARERRIKPKAAEGEPLREQQAHQLLDVVADLR